MYTDETLDLEDRYEKILVINGGIDTRINLDPAIVDLAVLHGFPLTPSDIEPYDAVKNDSRVLADESREWVGDYMVELASEAILWLEMKLGVYFTVEHECLWAHVPESEVQEFETELYTVIHMSIGYRDNIELAERFANQEKTGRGAENEIMEALDNINKEW